MQDALIELSDPQYDFLTSTKKHTGFVAGFGSGKSFIGTLKSLNKILSGIPKTAYYLPTYGDIRDIAFDGFPTVAEALGYDYKLNKTDKEFTLLDGKIEIGKVLFRNMSEPESIVGYQVGYTLIDETDILKQEIMDKAFKKILGRNRLIVPVEDEYLLNIFNSTGVIPDGTYWHTGRGMLCYINSIDVAGTPEGFKWFYDRFVTRGNKNTDLLIKASTYSNLHNLPDDFIDTLKSQYPKELFEAYVNGEFINLTSGTVFSYFKREIHATSNEEIKQGDNLLIGQDFNVGSCVSIIFVKRGNELHAVGEVISYDTRGIVQHFKDNYKDRYISFYPDASGESRKTSATESDLALLRGAGFAIFKNSQNPRIMDRVIIANNCFDKQIIKINPKLCPSLVKALEQHAYDSKTQLPEKFNTHPAVDDYTDAFSYCLAYLFPIVSGYNTAKLNGL